MAYSGLEEVELVMEVGGSFGIEIPDADAAQIVTDQNLLEYLSKRLGATDGECTLTELALARLQDAVNRTIGTSHEQVSFETTWDTLLPPGQVLRCWRAIECRVGARLHSLGPRSGTGWMELGLVVSCLVAPGWLMVVLAERTGAISALVGVVLLLGALVTVAVRVHRVSVGFPQEYKTVRDTATYFAAHHAKRLKGGDQWTKADVEFVVSTLTRELYPHGQ